MAPLLGGFFIEIVGEKAMAHRLRKMGTAVVRARPAMRLVAAELLNIEGAIFRGQGRRGGGSWKQDSEEWLSRKMRQGLDPRINIATRALMTSMSEPEAPHQILHIGDNRVLLGSDLPYAQAADHERPYSDLLESDKLKLRNIVEGYILERFYR